jgi:hypothetical protein
VGPDWESHVISELDSQLNKWSDTIPDHCTSLYACQFLLTPINSEILVRWDPSREDPKDLLQSANVMSLFYFTQIMVHRPFMTRTDKAAPLAYPSLAICTNAARSAARLAAILMRRMPAKVKMGPGLLVSCPTRIRP